MKEGDEWIRGTRARHRSKVAAALAQLDGAAVKRMDKQSGDYSQRKTRKRTILLDSQ